VGSAPYNLDLSVERATAIADYLQDRVDGWLPFYSNPTASKPWRTREDQYMLSALPDESAPFYTGPITGVADARTKEAVIDFQTFANGKGAKLDVDGVCGPLTRRELITHYMALDGTSLPPGTPLEMHGCGEFHNEVPTADGVANDENRRVEIFLFEGPVDPPKRTPCPSPGCPEYPEWLRRTFETVDFREDEPPPEPVLSNPRWDLSDPSPGDELVLTLRDTRHRTCPDREATIVAGGARIFARSDGSGRIRVQIPPGTDKVVVRYVPADMTTLVELPVALSLPPPDSDAGALARLRNLGYDVDEDRDGAIVRFQIDVRIAISGALDAATRERIREVHDA